MSKSNDRVVPDLWRDWERVHEELVQVYDEIEVGTIPQFPKNPRSPHCFVLREDRVDEIFVHDDDRAGMLVKELANLVRARQRDDQRARVVPESVRNLSQICSAISSLVI